ncbi:acyl carrier protein [Amycolatopsis anabasis]|uniref:acyl carrier protein n=1 Tax=Amycolatopsis anabasis TaxID=1840409 RepID=UPI00131B0623|nr:phosphopantetheine-binding protein [Amycolatopsis anabasis]
MSNPDADTVMRVLRQHTSPEVTSIKPSSNLELDLRMDSLDVIRLLETLEREFHITITEEELGELNVVSDVIRLVSRVSYHATEEGTDNDHP